jgi:hypothetical protein
VDNVAFSKLAEEVVSKIAFVMDVHGSMGNGLESVERETEVVQNGVEDLVNLSAEVVQKVELARNIDKKKTRQQN